MKNQYCPAKHHRKTIRLKGYDYAQEGIYFITIISHDRACLFGEIKNCEVSLNNAGRIANECWMAIPNHFPNVILHEYIIMPNHIHGVIEIVRAKNLSPIDEIGVHNLLLNEKEDEINPSLSQEHKGAKDFSPLLPLPPLRSPARTVGSVVRGFKVGVTKWMRKNTNTYDVWQRNYYEHIIRNEEAYNKISSYIISNPSSWVDDQFYLGA